MTARDLAVNINFKGVLRWASFVIASITLSFLLSSFEVLFQMQLYLILPRFLLSKTTEAAAPAQEIISALMMLLFPNDKIDLVNQGFLASAAVLLSLVFLLSCVQEFLCHVRHRIQMDGKLPSTEVLSHYNGGSYSKAIAAVGAARRVTKKM